MHPVRNLFRSVVVPLGLVAALLVVAPPTWADGVVLKAGPITFLGVSTSRTDDGLRINKVIRDTAAEAAPDDAKEAT